MATFGRSKNVVRRAVRPDRNFLRDKRRGGLAQFTLLSGGAPAKRGLFRRVLAAIAKVIAPRKGGKS